MRRARERMEVEGLSLASINRIVTELDLDPNEVELIGVERAADCGCCTEAPVVEMLWDWEDVPLPRAARHGVEVDEWPTTTTT